MVDDLLQFDSKDVMEPEMIHEIKREEIPEIAVCTFDGMFDREPKVERTTEESSHAFTTDDGFEVITTSRKTTTTTTTSQAFDTSYPGKNIILSIRLHSKDVNINMPSMMF